jgi:uncharacterized protein (DUF1015 family)
MAKIEAFKSLTYNPLMVEDISKVVCPPYDIIDAQGQDECYQRHPYNIIRLILSKDLAGENEQENKYTRAAGYMDDWARRNIFIQDTKPALYFYEQVFKISGAVKKRIGFIGLMRLDEEGQDQSVYPHEHTHTAPKEDRFRLIKSVEANLSPIFTIFSDEEKVIKKLFLESISKEKPLFEVLDDAGIQNRIWRMSDAALIDQIKVFFAEKKVFIADGHHRHEVARMFRDYKRREDPAHFKDSYNTIMTYFTALEDDGLCVLPTHRLIKNTRFNPEDLGTCFSVREIGSKEALVSEMKAKEEEIGVFGLYKDKKFFFLKVSDKRGCNRFIHEGPKEYKNLDVVILQKVVFDNLIKVTLDQIFYEIDLDKAVHAVDEKAADALFVLNATKVRQIRALALTGQVMPQKSTYFYPKLLSGFLIHKF